MPGLRCPSVPEATEPRQVAVFAVVGADHQDIAVGRARDVLNATVPVGRPGGVRGGPQRGALEAVTGSPQVAGSVPLVGRLRDRADQQRGLVAMNCDAREVGAAIRRLLFSVVWISWATAPNPDSATR